MHFTERLVEVPFVHAAVLHRRPARVLDVGCCESHLAVELAALGIPTWGLDMRDYPLSHPNLTFVRADVRQTPFPDGFFDCIVALSTLEHIGMGHTPYGPAPLGADADGDKAAMKELVRLLAPQGRMVITLPFGRAADTAWYRVYDRRRLEGLAAAGGLVIPWLRCFARQGGFWQPVAPETGEALDSAGAAAVQAVACFIACRRDSDPAQGWEPLCGF